MNNQITNLNSSSIQWTTLLGSKGEFKNETSKLILHYCLTVASNKLEGSGEFHLLDQLKPLRERIDPSKLKSLEDLLQRDVNDDRVGHQVLKYLFDNSVVFFPSIVVLLIPKDSLQGAASYPDPEPFSNNGENSIKYGDYWIHKPLLDANNQKISISELKINFSKTIPVIIDGQHRTMAFKVASNMVDFNGKNKIYEDFYTNNSTHSTDGFSSDLPVTLIWFDQIERSINAEVTSNHSIQIPIRELGRGLFLDINQSSQHIGNSRKILLNSDERDGFVTRLFYKSISSFGVTPTPHLSLLHSGFDFPYDSSDRKAWTINTLFTPETFSFALSWFLFGTPTYRDLTKNSVQRESKTSRRYSDKFDRLFEQDDYNYYFIEKTNLDDDTYYLVNPNKKNNLADKLDEILNPTLHAVLNANGFYRAVFSAVHKLDLGFKNNYNRTPYNDHVAEEAWERLFLGGEGLFYVFNTSQNRNNSSKRYSKAASILQEELMMLISNDLSLELDVTKSILQSFQSTAFIVGNLMAFESFLFPLLYDGKSVDELTDAYVKILNEIDWNEFCTAAFQLKKNGVYFQNVDTRSWPSYRNLFIRFIMDTKTFIEMEVDPMVLRGSRDSICLERVLFELNYSIRLKDFMKINNIDDEVDVDDATKYDLKEKTKETIEKIFSELVSLKKYVYS
jgi:hypothetical protein